MSEYRARQVEAALLRKGFRLEKRAERYFFLYVNGQRTAVRTFISHGERDIDDNLAALMSRQLHLAKKEFRQLVECTLSEAGYVKLLRERQVL